MYITACGGSCKMFFILDMYTLFVTFTILEYDVDVDICLGLVYACAFY